MQTSIMKLVTILPLLVYYVSADLYAPEYQTTVLTNKPENTDMLSFVTLTSTTTRTYTIRHSSTTDVRVTSAIVVPLTVTQYETKRSYVRDDPDTITSFIRLTKSQIVIETTTVEKFPVRTVVSTFTQFQTVTSTVDLWQPITHYQTSFEIVRVPVHETQELIQVVYDTTTVFSTVVFTSYHNLLGFGY